MVYEVVCVENFQQPINHEDFSHILRLLNTNVEGHLKVTYALTKIKGIGRRVADIMCKRAQVDITKRAGELTSEEQSKLLAIINAPRAFRIPNYFMNRRRDYKTNQDLHLKANEIAQKWREDFDGWKKTRRHRGFRHMCELKVRGQRTKTTGHGVTIKAFHSNVK